MTHNPNSFTIAIPTYNRGQFIHEAISSVINQIQPSDQILIVDDGSTDNTPQILNSFANNPQIKYIVKTHTNAPHTRNIAIQEAHNPWILWLDSDDILLPNVISHYRKLLSQFPQVEVLYGNLQLFGAIQNAPSSHMTFPDYYQKNEILLYHMFSQNRIPNPAVVVKKSVYQTYGPYDIHFNRLHDYQFWIRVAPYIQLKHARRDVCRWRWHTGNMSSGSVQTDKRFNFMIVEEFLKRYPLEKIFPFFKGNNHKQSLARCYYEIGKQYVKAALFQEAVPKAIEYLLNSISLMHSSNAYIELEQLLSVLPFEILNQYRSAIPSQIIEKARSVLSKANGRSFIERYKIASLNKKVGNLERSRTCFLQLERLLSNGKKDQKALLTGVYFHLGEVYHLKSDKDKARFYLDRCLQLNPLHQKAAQYLKQLS